MDMVIAAAVLCLCVTTRRLRMRYTENDPEGLKVFDCPECLTENAVLEDDTGYHCRACGKRFGEDFFDDWRDGIYPEDLD